MLQGSGGKQNHKQRCGRHYGINCASNDLNRMEVLVEWKYQYKWYINNSVLSATLTRRLLLKMETIKNL